MRQMSHLLRTMCNIIHEKLRPQDNSWSSHSLMTSRNDNACPTHASASGDPHNHPCTTLHPMMLSLRVNAPLSPVTGVITATTDGSQSANAPTALAKPPAAVKPTGAPSHAPGVARCPATTCAQPQRLPPEMGNGGACSREHATNPGNRQKVPRARQALRKPCGPRRLGCSPSQPPVKSPPYTAGPTQHTMSPATVKYAGAPFHVPGHRVRPPERPWPPHSLPLKREGAARPIGHASTSGDSQTVSSDFKLQNSLQLLRHQHHTELPLGAIYK